MIQLFGNKSNPKEELVNLSDLINPNSIENLTIHAYKTYNGSYRIYATIQFKNGGDTFTKEFDYCTSLKDAYIKLFEFCEKL